MLRRGLADRAENWTRFLLLARTPVDVPDRVPSKTSLVLVTRHEEGALLRCLEILSRSGHSLTKLESRPRPGSPFEYLFFIDFEGNVAEPRTQQVLDELREATLALKVLGSYPAKVVRPEVPADDALEAVLGRGRPQRLAALTPDVTTLSPDGRKLLRLEVRNAQTPIEKKPSWIKTRAVMGPEYTELKSLVKREGLHTVCEEAGCPNIYECWEDREATFLIGGDQCTRRCDFCNIDTGKPAAYDTDEPRRVAESVATMGLRYATITGVARDDLPDGGAWLYAETVRLVHEAVPGIGVELLIPDFDAEPAQLAEVFASRPEVLAHNVETVPRIFRRIRPGFRYERSLDVIRQARAAGLVTKSNLILGMGEERDEISEAMQDLHDAGCELLTITQYLRPSPRHHPVDRWVRPEEFVALREEAEEIGFSGVMSGPLVRSSYRAGRLYEQALASRASV